MNLKSDSIRKYLSVFDEKGIFKRSVSRSAQLKDEGYSLHDIDDIRRMVAMTRSAMAKLSNVELAALPNIHSGRNGRNDCDNFNIVGAYILKLLHDRECREDIERGVEMEYAIFPFARKDRDHTECICLSYLLEWYLVDFIGGTIKKITEKNRPAIMVIL